MMAELSGMRPENDVLRVGVYRHYKHRPIAPRYYLALGLARHSETEETLVIYVPLYPAGGLRMAARPLSSWSSKVEVDGEWVERFEFVGTEIPEFSV